MKCAAVRFTRLISTSISLILTSSLIASTSGPFAAKVVVKHEGRSGSSKATPTHLPNQAQRRDGELLVRFRHGTTEAEKDAVIGSHSARRARQLAGSSAVEIIELGAGQTPESAASALSSQPEVEFVEPNFLIAGEQIGTNDPRFPEQWALRNTGQQGGQQGSDIGAAAAWARVIGSAQTVIAVIDSGVDFSHPDLRNNEWTDNRERENGRDDDHDGYVDDLHGWDWVANSNQIADPYGHGTSVAGILAAEGNNGVGTSGVMWRASLMSLRVLDNTGTGDVASAIEAIDYASAHGAQVINLSWGTDGESAALKDAITRAGSRGVLVICSAGNSGRSIDAAPYYPASYDLPNLISVAATDNVDQITTWSNWGVRGVVLAAPGSNILTTHAGGDYTTVTGTSAAAPAVSGIAGLVKTLRPDLGTAAVKSAIINGARRVAGLSGVIASGAVASASGAVAVATALPLESGTGNGNDLGNGVSNGQGGGVRLGPPPSPEHGSGGRGRQGSFDVNSPTSSAGAPSGGLPNLDDARAGRMPTATPLPAPIHADLCSAYTEECSGGGLHQDPPGGDPDFSTARTRPHNATGGSTGSTTAGRNGVNLGSQNFNWDLPLLGLAGRAGLDLNIALYYNSLLWTRQGTRIQYNADRGFPGPGFRLSFPTLQRQFIDSDSGMTSYLLMTESGGRVELSGSGFNTYEATDGSNIQLVQYYKLIARHSGKALDVQWGGRDDGANVQQWSDNNTWAQQWQLVPTDGGYYKLIARHSAKVLDVAGGGTDNGANVQQWEDSGGYNQQWMPVAVGGGYYKLVARHSGKVLDVEGGYTSDGANVRQWDYVGGYNQQWMLTPTPGQLVARTPDGTQYTFGVFANNEYKCTEIKDRNGNYITVSYNAGGGVAAITDTLGRVVSFNYYADGNLDTITQTWNREVLSNGQVTTSAETHRWAKFYYGSVYVQPNFPGIAVFGPNNANITVLTRVDLPDNSAYVFGYENPWGVVNRITHYAGDGHQLAYTFYNIPPTSTAQSDSPRFTERRDWAENWNGNNEAITSYSVDPSGSNGWTQVTTPDGTIYKEFYATSNDWQKGLTTKTQVCLEGTACSDADRKKWTTIAWTQDDLSLSYQKNPRVAETNVYDDSGNRNRTVIEYTSYGLPSAVYEYAANATTVLRKTVTDYRFDPSFINRHVIGLPSELRVYEGVDTLRSKEEYHYDWVSGYLTAQAPSVNHDTGNYGAGFLGRGILTGVLRYNVNYPEDPNQAIWAQANGYDLAGNTLWTQDAAGHRTTYGYADNFSNGGNTRGTFAYLTSITDADGFGSTAQYNFDMGEVILTQDPKGAATRTIYDEVGRPLQLMNLVNEAYTRWVYFPSLTAAQRYTTVSQPGVEAYSIEVYDGEGRARAAASAHPNSAGGYSGQYFVYDVMGRLVQQSNPTEIDDGWAPAGVDAPANGGAGWAYTMQTYDWNDRPVLTTYPNGNTAEVEGYVGCGCAGGEVRTLRDERGRRRRLYDDVLGRLVKVEELNWDTSVYSTTTYGYNASNQLTTINQSGLTRTLEYDGFGRLWHRTTPEQGQTTFSYNPDDTVQSVTDARSAVQTFGYNNRHLVTSISFTPTGTVANTPNVSFTYDEAGNRTSMTDGLGTATYHYDTLSRMDWEERTFTGVAGPQSGAYHISYGYNLSGELISVTNPWNAQVSYAYDAAGRPVSVNGMNYAGISTYAQGLKYRAFGAIKEMSYGNGRVLSAGYDTRMRLTVWDVAGALGNDYYYEKYSPTSQLYDSTLRITYARNRYDPSLNRSYDYDQVGRLTEAHSGNEADAHAGASPSWPTNPSGPYSHHYEYDQLGNMTRRLGWGGVQNGYLDSTQAFSGNRQQQNPWNGALLQYDSTGNTTYDGYQHYVYDVTGQQVSSSGGAANLSMAYDGDRLRVQKNENGDVTYYLRSSVLGGQIIAEIRSNPQWGWYWDRGYVYLGSQLLALQYNSQVWWVYRDPVTKSQRIDNSAGVVAATVDLDPWGGETGRGSNSAFQPHKFTSYERDADSGDQAMMRSYEGKLMRFSQPDPWDGSYDPADPQSLNRYAYTMNDPVNYVDPTGLDPVVHFYHDVWGGDSWHYGPSGVYGGYASGGVSGGGNVFAVFSQRFEVRGPNGDTGPAFYYAMIGGQSHIEQQIIRAREKRVRREQQSNFNSCARRAFRTFRADYVIQGGKAALGGILIGGGTVIVLEGTGAQSGVGILAAQEFAAKGELEEALSALKVAGFLALSPFTGGAKLGAEAVNEGRESEKKLHDDVAKCEKRYPRANHNGAFLNF